MSEKNIFELNEVQKAKIQPHIQQIVKSAFLAGVEYSKAIAENSENKIDDIVVPVLAGPAETYADQFAGSIKL